MRAVLFDLDDTLNDRKQSWRRFIERLIAPPLPLLVDCDIEQTLRLIDEKDAGGRGDKELLFGALSQQLNWCNAMDSAAVERLWRALFPTCTTTRDSALDVLSHCRRAGIKTAVVTNGREDNQSAKIRQMGIAKSVDAIVISGAFGQKKPTPAIYEHALDRLGVTAVEALFVGDHPEADVFGPSQLGMPTAWLRNGRQWAIDLPYSPSYQIDCLSELQSILGRTKPSP